MLTSEFIDNYCTPTGIIREGFVGTYEVYLVSPAAILSTMPSVDSDADEEIYGLEATWKDTFAGKRRDNRLRSDHSNPLVFLAKEGFRVPLCILTEWDIVYKFHNGNHRLAAAIDLGFDRVPVVFMDIEDEDSFDDRWEVTEVRDGTYDVLVPPPAKIVDVA